MDGKMTTADYPPLYGAADVESVRAQAKHLRLQMAYLATLIAAGVVGAGGPAIEKDTVVTGTVATSFLAAGVVLLWGLRATRCDKAWFDNRAVAESAKTASWRYMMGLVPYGREGPEADVDGEFERRLEEISAARPLAATTPGIAATDFMRRLRAAPFKERREFYLRNRLGNQQAWYTRKADNARKAATAWFWVISVLQVVAIPLAIWNLVVGHSLVDVAPIAAALVGPFIAWTQIRRYDELAQTYSLAAQELTSLDRIARDAPTEEAFLAAALQAETASSREHTMWCARRETPASRSA